MNAKGLHVSPSGKKKPPLLFYHLMQRQEDQKLHALILTNTSENTFKPLTESLPVSLFPLANIPLISFSLNLLEIPLISDVIVVSNNPLLAQYLPSSVILINSPYSNTGDILRDIDAKQIIKNDFILINSDNISNIDLTSVILLHKQRKLTDKNLLSTLVLQKSSPGHRSNSQSAVFTMNPLENTILAYSKIPASLDKDLFKKHVQVRYDLIDSGIDICVPEVLLLFTENFDYQHLRLDFLKGILESDILNKTVYAHIVDGYSVRVNSSFMYDAVCRDVIGRWAFPIVPDSNLLGDSFYVCGRRNVYKDVGVSLGKFSILL